MACQGKEEVGKSNQEVCDLATSEIFNEQNNPEQDKKEAERESGSLLS